MIMTVAQLFRRICIFLLLPAFLMYHYFFYVDFAYGCRITITPSFFEWNNTLMKQALKGLKRASPEDYQKICRNVHTINPNPSLCGTYGGGCFYPPQEFLKSDGRTIFISTYHGDLSLTMAVIVHETCHVIQYQEKRGLSEGECYAKDDRILRNIVMLDALDETKKP